MKVLKKVLKLIIFVILRLLLAAFYTNTEKHVYIIIIIITFRGYVWRKLMASSYENKYVLNLQTHTAFCFVIKV